MYNYIRRGENVTSVEEYDIVWDETDGVTNPVLVGTMVYSFDGKGKQFRKKYVPADGSDEQKYVFAFKDEQNVAVQLPTGAVSHAKTDHFGRKVFDELQLGKGFLNRTFTYYDGVVSQTHQTENKRVSDPATMLVKEIKYSDGRTIQYEYDEEERITKVIDSVDGTIVYTYDALGQLLTETKGEGPAKTVAYDQYGNITSKNGVAYGYDSSGAWKDLLTSVGNRTISYDANGNPTTYLGHSLTWEKGRQLKQFDTFTYKYNNEGVRIEKVENCKKHRYVLDGTTILKEIVTDTCCNGNGYTNEYLYDLDGTVCGIKHNDAVFYFCKNLQGDVIAITDDSGAVVAKYSYDAWGKCTIDEDISDCSIATVNPFRYRGYYYDAEIGMYYLQSRYYDPEIGRFINADSVETLNAINGVFGCNLFAYCHNDPIDNTDSSGNLIAETIFKLFAGIIFGLLIQLLSDFITHILQCVFHGQSDEGFKVDPRDYISSALSWAITFANPFACFTKKGKMVGKVLYQLTKFIPFVAKHAKKWEDVNQFEFWTDFFAIIISMILDYYFDRKMKKQIAEIQKFKQKGRVKKNTIYKSKLSPIKIRRKVFGEIITLSVNFGPTFLTILWKVVTGVKIGESI